MKRGLKSVRANSTLKIEVVEGTSPMKRGLKSIVSQQIVHTCWLKGPPR